LTLALEKNRNSRIKAEDYNMLWMFNLAKPFRVDWDATKVKGRLKYLSNRKPVGDKVE